MSSRAMNMPKHIAMKAIMRRGSMRSAALPEGAFMSTSASVRSGARGRGEGCDGTRLGIDTDDNRHPGSQRAALGDIGGEAAARAQPRPDLGENAPRLDGGERRE